MAEHSNTAGKRIGFVDQRLDNFHANTYLAALRGPLQERGFVVVGATAPMGDENIAWAARHELPLFATVDELNEHVDYFLILAPSDPQLHWPMCQRVLPFGKPTFVDKTFAPDLETALKIFALADEYQVALQTTSALRNTNVQAFLRDARETVQSLFVCASGTSFDEYGIHPVELVVSCLGAAATDVMRLGSDEHPRLVIRFAGDRLAVIDMPLGTDVPYAAAVTTTTGHHQLTIDDSALFVDAAAAILDFFEAGRAMVDRSETLLIRRVLDLATEPDFRNQFRSVARDASDEPPVLQPHWNRLVARSAEPVTRRTPS